MNKPTDTNTAKPVGIMYQVELKLDSSLNFLEVIKIITHVYPRRVYEYAGFETHFF